METRTQIPVEYEAEEKLVSPIKEKMENVSLSGCICRVSEEAKEENQEQYKPMIVSIGPFYHGEERLKPMEDQKWRYLHALLTRNPSSNTEPVLDSCLKQLKGLEQKARRCYVGKVDLNSDEFVEMLLVDGCFIIELFLKSYFKGLRRRDDVCFSSETLSRLTLDLILLENQIPFFIIQRLFCLVPLPKQCSLSVAHLALRFFRKLIPGGIAELPPERPPANYHHLLDLIRQFYLPTVPELLQFKRVEKELKNAERIKSSGIKFRKGSPENLLNIRFLDGVLEIPPLKANDTTYTETLLRNFIALEEHCSPHYTKHITSYVFLMNCLLSTKRDVRLLQNSGIIIVPRDRRREVLDLFKKLTDLRDDNDGSFTEFCYTEVCNKVCSYQKKNLLFRTIVKITQG